MQVQSTPCTQNCCLLIFSILVRYNLPEQNKHRRRSLGNLSASSIKEHVNTLATTCLKHYTDEDEWTNLKPHLENLLKTLKAYSDSLIEKNKYMKLQHTRIHTNDGECTAILLPRNIDVNPAYTTLQQALATKEVYQFVDVSDFAPESKYDRYMFLKNLKDRGLAFPVVFCSFSYGGSVIDFNFIWKIDPQSNSLTQTTSLIQEIKKELPSYHPRALRRAFVQRFGVLAKNTPVAVLRNMYEELTNSASAAPNLNTLELDLRVTEALDCEDPDLLTDLRALNGNKEDKYSTFWEKMSIFLEEQSSVHERRQSAISYMAVAFSARDLVEQVKKLCPEGTDIPSSKWVRYQFHPKHPNSMQAKRFTKKFNLRMMVQSRQLRLSHEDSHYSAAYFR